MKIYTLKDPEGTLRPQSFLCYPEFIKWADKEIKRLTKDGSTIVLAEILEVEAPDSDFKN